MNRPRNKRDVSLQLVVVEAVAGWRGADYVSDHALKIYFCDALIRVDRDSEQKTPVGTPPFRRVESRFSVKLSTAVPLQSRLPLFAREATN